jgi:hypothetical protein
MPIFLEARKGTRYFVIMTTTTKTTTTTTTEDTDMTTTRYDDTLIDDASAPKVVRARTIGREWAEREWQALPEEAMEEQADQLWYPTDADALSLVADLDPDDDDHELASICNRAAAAHWDGITESYRSQHPVD